MSEEKKGIFRSSVRLLGRSAKGALGGEFITAGSALGRSVKDSINARGCPRCFERSLFSIDGRWTCVRSDICGWHGSDEDVQMLREATCNISPLVFAVAKGNRVNVSRDAKQNCFFSWLLWLITALILVYSVYATQAISMFMGCWIALVGVMLGINAVRFSYRAQYLLGRFRGEPIEFLKEPRLWFVLR